MQQQSCAACPMRMLRRAAVAGHRVAEGVESVFEGFADLVVQQRQVLAALMPES